MKSRREAAAYGFACNNGRGDLQNFAHVVCLDIMDSNSRDKNNIGVEKLQNADTLGKFDSSIQGQFEIVFDRLPQWLLRKGVKSGWTCTMKTGQKLLAKY